MTRLILPLFHRLTPSKKRKSKKLLSLKTRRTPDVSWRRAQLRAMLARVSMLDAL